MVQLGTDETLSSINELSHRSSFKSNIKDLENKKDSNNFNFKYI